MSTLDDKAQEVSKDIDSGKTEQASSQMDDSDRSDGAGGFIILFFIVGFAASLVVGWIVFPKLLYSQKKQPIDFNHAVHMEAVDNGCESCHFFREDGSFSGSPKLEQCIDCHEEVIGVSPEETKFVEEYVANEKEVPWLIYARQPDCVFFSHAAHVRGAEIDCTVCHGHVGESEHLRVYEENRITGYSRDIWGKNISGLKKNTWDRMKMDDCAQCHKDTTDKKTSVQTQRDACFVCHK
jgi:hypothetical protein